MTLEYRKHQKLTKNNLAMYSKEHEWLESYIKHTTSQYNSGGVSVSFIPKMSTSCNWNIEFSKKLHQENSISYEQGNKHRYVGLYFIQLRKIISWTQIFNTVFS